MRWKQAQIRRKERNERHEGTEEAFLYPSKKGGGERYVPNSAAFSSP
jgi:hypothetical protein